MASRSAGAAIGGFFKFEWDLKGRIGKASANQGTLAASMRIMADHTVSDFFAADHMKLVEVLFTVTELSFGSGLFVFKECFFMALKTECKVIFEVFDIEVFAITRTQQVLCFGAVDFVAFAAFAFDDRLVDRAIRQGSPRGDCQNVLADAFNFFGVTGEAGCSFRFL